jgi:hypothetical protein
MREDDVGPQSADTIKLTFIKETSLNLGKLTERARLRLIVGFILTRVHEPRQVDWLG